MEGEKGWGNQLIGRHCELGEGKCQEGRGEERGRRQREEEWVKERVSGGREGEG